MTTYTLRSGSTAKFFYMFIVIAVIVLATAIKTGGLGDALWSVPVAGLIAVLGWALYWRPAVQVGPEGVRVINPFTVAQIPWGDFKFIERRYGMYLYSNAGRKIPVWAFPSKAGVRAGSDAAPVTEAAPVLSFDGGAVGGGAVSAGAVSSDGKVAPLGTSLKVTMGQADEIITKRAAQIRGNKKLRAELGAASAWAPTTTRRVSAETAAPILLLVAAAAVMLFGPLGK